MQLSVEEYKELLKKKKQSKYHNIKVEYDGYKFDSRDECKRYKQLKLLVRGGNISALKIHPRYLLQEGFNTKSGKRIRPIHYTADFEYIDEETGELVVEDVKGARTQVFNLKEKMFLKRYPDLVITLINVDGG